jgi:hypothetical protein
MKSPMLDLDHELIGNARNTEGDRIVLALEEALAPFKREMAERYGAVGGGSIVNASIGRLFVRDMIRFYRASVGEVPDRDHIHHVMEVAADPLCHEANREYRRHMVYSVLPSVVVDEEEEPHG